MLESYSYILQCSSSDFRSLEDFVDDLDDALTYTANPRCHRIFARQVLEAGLGGDDSALATIMNTFPDVHLDDARLWLAYLRDCDSSQTVSSWTHFLLCHGTGLFSQVMVRSWSVIQRIVLCTF